MSWSSSWLMPDLKWVIPASVCWDHLTRWQSGLTINKYIHTYTKKQLKDQRNKIAIKRRGKHRQTDRQTDKNTNTSRERQVKKKQKESRESKLLSSSPQIRLWNEYMAHGQHAQTSQLLWCVEHNRWKPTWHLGVQANLDTSLNLKQINPTAINPKIS